MRGMPGIVAPAPRRPRPSRPPPTAALVHEFAHLGLLLGVQAVIEVAERGNHLRALALDRLGLLADEGLGLGAVELVTGHQRTQLRTRVGALRDERGTLLL